MFSFTPEQALCLQVGGRLGTVFDEDPKRWRMLAEALGTLGMSLEIATAFAPPQAFLLLAGALPGLWASCLPG